MITYDHPVLGIITAVVNPESCMIGEVSVPAMVDWAAVLDSGKIIGYVVDQRGVASEQTPPDDDDRPFEAWKGHQPEDFICETHSLRGALAAIGNNYNK